MLRTCKLLAAIAIIVLAAGLLGGCKSNPDSKKLTIDEVRSDPTPDLSSIAWTHDQRKSRRAYVADTNLRQIWDDIDEIMLFDRPSRMAKQVHVP